jgi:O-antigen/teichoic acid export membrane protein
MIASVLSVYLILNLLSLENYGYYNLLLFAIVAINNLVDLNFTKSYFTKVSADGVSKLEFICQVGAIFPQIIISYFLLSFYFELLEIETVSQYLIASVVFFGIAQNKIFAVVKFTLEAQGKTKDHQLLQTLGQFVFVLVLVLLGYREATIANVFWSNFIIVSTVCYLAIQKIKFDPSSRMVDFRYHKKFMIPLILSTLVIFIYAILDRTLLAYSFDGDVIGIYGLAKQASVLLMFFVTSLITVYWQVISNSKHKKVKLIVTNLFLLINLNLILAAILFIIFSLSFFVSLVDYDINKYYFFILLIIFCPVFQSINQILLTYRMANGYTKFVGNVNLFSALGVIMLQASSLLIEDLALKMLFIPASILVVEFISTAANLWLYLVSEKQAIFLKVLSVNIIFYVGFFLLFHFHAGIAWAFLGLAIFILYKNQYFDLNHLKKISNILKRALTIS